MPKKIIKIKAEKQTTNYNTNLQKYWPIKNTHTHTQNQKGKKDNKECAHVKKVKKLIYKLKEVGGSHLSSSA